MWIWGNNVLAYFAERADSYTFYHKDVLIKSLPTFIVAVATFVILLVLAWRNGRNRQCKGIPDFFAIFVGL